MARHTAVGTISPSCCTPRGHAAPRKRNIWLSPSQASRPCSPGLALPRLRRARGGDPADALEHLVAAALVSNQTRSTFRALEECARRTPELRSRAFPQAASYLRVQHSPIARFYVTSTLARLSWATPPRGRDLSGDPVASPRDLFCHRPSGGLGLLEAHRLPPLQLLLLQLSRTSGRLAYQVGLISFRT